MLSQVLRFTFPSGSTISSAEFLKLRQSIAARGATAQYYGYTAPTRVLSLPRKRHEVCWVVQWPDDLRDRSAVVEGLATTGIKDATSLLFEFDDAQLENLAKALEAPVCEFACIRLKDDAPLENEALQKSMHKTYADTYQIQGFTGGYWAYAMNTNETAGVSCLTPGKKAVPKAHRRLGVYYLGWESIELHEDGTQTEAFSEEINQLQPYFGPGSGAWYAMLRKHR
ncbi:hypothetical protein TGAM01_v206810 [Trichoderma gamsii]|uniref:Uncharacterized protein n=1 Tax=Trichoderma gamsii TaxID=398673 RepID=A0A2K0THU6_9HYPO|nr:hypothetical protein TGAM01_v206810 [Trichoderma gamsii]PNP45087.1 hypothetical protein TGAMA5MH_03137 [Trichoderma gamsii]PON24478.1 hypothetical protein TGAM01_v206810 [Trichoderma gamsii]